VAYQVPVCCEFRFQPDCHVCTHTVEHLYAQLVADPLEHNYGGSRRVSIQSSIISNSHQSWIYYRNLGTSTNEKFSAHYALLTKSCFQTAIFQL